MIDQYKHQQLQIGLVSPQQIKAWDNKNLPNGEVVGEVTRPSTFHYKMYPLGKYRFDQDLLFWSTKSKHDVVMNIKVIGNLTA
ncbi:hypothetical protein CFC21_019071 [Triticum aestivum]|uniref:Uncharacterized protein n=2 Tax=Triticum aestivum TaxID=4565 RepID=A0A9R1J4B7_WHEAT|nr:hypothetical protein CFC21_019071 [Triticum aestivum]